MRLPAERTAMNPVNATALYVSASRAVLQCDPKQPNTFTDMYNILPFFRQTLACVVCGKYCDANPDSAANVRYCSVYIARESKLANHLIQHSRFHYRLRFNGGVCVT